MKKALFFTRMLALTAAAVMLFTAAMLTGCTGKVPLQVNEPFEFPYKEHVELSWWYGYDDTYFGDAFIKLEDHPFMQRLEQETNVHVEFVQPTATTLDGLRGELEQMIAAGTVTDMVTQGYFGMTLAGSTLDSVIDEEIYLPLNDYIDIQMPNFNAVRDEYGIIDKVIITPQNNIVYIPMISGIETYMSSTKTSGLVIRKDFLDELQMDVPVTVDDWYEVLSAFKVMLGVETPIAVGSMRYAASMSNDVFITCYDQMYEMYLDKETGKVAYGASKEGVRQYVTMMHQWVSEGLASAIDATAEQRASNAVGAWCGNTDDIMNLKAQATDPDFNLVAAPDPVLKEGDKITYRESYRPIGTHMCNSVYLGYECSQPAIAAKWIDQFFTEEKYMEASYGLEGEDYTLNADGTVTFTEKITGNPNGIRYGIAQNACFDSFWHDPDVIKNYVFTPEAREACDVWSLATNENNMVSLDVLALTTEESDILSTLGNFWAIQMGNLKGFINGTMDLSEWDTHVAQMEDGGIAEYVEVYQSAWERYLAK